MNAHIAHFNYGAPAVELTCPNHDNHFGYVLIYSVLLTMIVIYCRKQFDKKYDEAVRAFEDNHAQARQEINDKVRMMNDYVNHRNNIARQFRDQFLLELNQLETDYNDLYDQLEPVANIVIRDVQYDLR